MVNRLLGERYRITKSLGKGGRGAVYLCHDSKLHKDWAVKALENAKDLERSMELELLKTISCNVFPRIVDIVKEGEQVFLVMDYVEGITLKEKMRQQMLTEKEVRSWALDIARGIRYLHQMSVPILYMDCKPDNIMLTSEGEIRLVDLGSAYICLENKKQRISGTKYFAPKEQREQIEKDNMPDVRTDIYAFGMTLYYLLTGGERERRKNGKLCVKSINPSVSWGMCHIIEKCTMENPDKRYQSMDEVIDQIIHIRKLSKWKRGKVYLHGAWTKLGKTGCAILSLVSAYSYQFQKNSLFLIISAISFLILFISCTYQKLLMYELKRDIFCGTGKKILYTLLLVAGLSGILHVTSYAAKENRSTYVQNRETEPEDFGLDVVLYDSLGRKILIKDGSIWKIEEDIIVEIPMDELEKGIGEISICYSNDEGGISKEYTFGCCKE